VGRGPWAVGRGPWAVGRGPWAVRCGRVAGDGPDDLVPFLAVAQGGLGVVLDELDLGGRCRRRRRI